MTDSLQGPKTDAFYRTYGKGQRVYIMSQGVWLQLQLHAQHLCSLPTGSNVIAESDVRAAFVSVVNFGNAWARLFPKIVQCSLDLKSFVQSQVAGLWVPVDKQGAKFPREVFEHVVTTALTAIKQNRETIAHRLDSVQSLGPKLDPAPLHSLLETYRNRIEGDDEAIKEARKKLETDWADLYAANKEFNSSTGDLMIDSLMTAVDVASITAEVVSGEPPSGDKVKAALGGTVESAEALEGMVDSANAANAAMSAIGKDTDALLKLFTERGNDTLALGFLQYAWFEANNMVPGFIPATKVLNALDAAWDTLEAAYKTLQTKSGSTEGYAEILDGLDAAALASEWGKLAGDVSEYAKVAYVVLDRRTSP